MEAIITTGGKQYQVREGDELAVEKLAGPSVTLTPILVTKDGKSVGTGKAAVAASVVEERKGEKLVVFKMKAKKRYRVKAGHRQKYSIIRIDKITA